MRRNMQPDRVRPAAVGTSRHREVVSATSPAIVAALLAAILIAFAGSFTGQFVFDDVNEIARNQGLANLPPWRAMFAGKTLPARPLPYLTFAINRRLHQDRLFGYHAVNLAIHMIAALAVFDLVRTTLRSPRLRDTYAARADLLAGIVATIWAVHPLQTQAVTYVYQRIESMAGMFELVSLATWARAGATGWNPRLAAVAIAAAAAAMASKESAVVLPVMAVAYDWCFFDRETWRLRRPWYAAIFASWIVLAMVMWIEGGEFQELKEGGATPFAHLLTQGSVILHYLRLTFLPVRLCIDYAWPIASDWLSVLPACLLVLAGVIMTAVALAKRRPWAFPAAFFFLALAPTSSLMPVQAAAAEHRMYLPLAGVATLAVLACDEFLRHRFAARSTLIGITVVGIVILALALRTHERNRIYADPKRLWAEAVERNPQNATAQGRLAELIFFSDRGDVQAALAHAEAAVAADPRSDVYHNLLLACDRPDRLDFQEQLARRGWQQDSAAFGPESKEALDAAGRLITVLRNQGRVEGAELASENLPAMRRVLGPNHLTTLATGVIAAEAALAHSDPVAAERHARESWNVLVACASRPPALVRRNATVLAESLRRLDRGSEAEQLLRTAFTELVQANSQIELPAVAEALADAIAANGRPDEAVATYRRLYVAAEAAGATNVVRRLAEKIRATTSAGTAK